MNRPRIATVLSARDWEPNLVDAARRDPTVRVVRRAYDSQDLDRAGPLDVVVVGAETSWITTSRIRSIRDNGARVIGVYPQGDRPGRDLLQRGGVDAALPDTTAPEQLLIAASMAATQHITPNRGGRLISVTGPRGAPGRTEVALSLAQTFASRTPSAIIDLDTEAPSVTFRLGLDPGPDLGETIDVVRTSDHLIARKAPIQQNLTVVGGASPSPSGMTSTVGVAALLDTVLASFEVTIADIGPWRPDQTILATSDAGVIVCDAQPMSLIRAAGFVRDWEGPIP